MKILVIKRTPPKRFLIELHTTKLVREIAILAGKGKYSKAVEAALAKGRLEKEIRAGELKTIRADVLLTEESDG